MNVSQPLIYKEPAELHCPLQGVPVEVISTTHRSRDYSVWESDTGTQVSIVWREASFPKAELHWLGKPDLLLE